MTTANMQVNLQLLAKMLHLPPNVNITGFVSDMKGDWHICLAGDLPGSYPLIATYEYEHNTNVKFKGFKKA